MRLLNIPMEQHCHSGPSAAPAPHVALPPVFISDARAWQLTPPLLRSLLLSDGTISTAIAACFQEPLALIPLEVALPVPLPPLLHRHILLEGSLSRRRYLHASSALKTGHLPPRMMGNLAETRLGIGEWLQQNRLESFREVLEIRYLTEPSLAQHLHTAPDSPLVQRTYCIHIDGVPSIHIRETFPLSLYSIPSENPEV